ncbi:MAG: cupin domain-containing protein [Candidatus Omnitrophica bacterium]|nr:cupin domain-containing protein [Candidatus Omnitrophota bacterium]MDD5671409.1 cupin domain-containing protein [Candidatus Omnitrophota bacterium]
MGKISVEKLDDKKLKDMGVFRWPIWEKEVSKFNWHYDSQERCYFLEGKVTVTTKEGKVGFGKGDFVTFPTGLSCTWEVHEPVRKHYQFS